MSNVCRWVSIAAVALLLLAPAGAGAQNFVNFESGHVRPLAMSPAGAPAVQLFAVNTPDNRLEIYDVSGAGLTLAAEVAVGLEPVAVATRLNGAGHTEVWVVNHLSDSISIVGVNPANLALSRVTRTLLVGDEPRDIIFAGSAHTRAFITCAHRGQNRGSDPQLTTAGTPRADVWVFDVNNLGAQLGGTPMAGTPLSFFTDTPRALAASPSGSTVYVAGFETGNQSTTITEGAVTNNGGLPPNPPGSTPGRPNTGLIVKFNGTHFVDEINRNWDARVPFTLPDKDVFLINADANPAPVAASAPNFVQHVGTVLFNMAVRPNGKVYVSNTDALNQVRFEPSVRGHIAESRITIINGTTPTAVHLNPHITNYAANPTPADIPLSLAFPTDMTFSADGNTLFVTAFGSGKISALNANSLEGGTVSQQQIAVGQGPSGIVLDQTQNRLYVMNRIDHTITMIGNASSPSRAVFGSPVPLRFDPSPPAAKNGRRFLYDASVSGHGDNACASCHIFGDFDSLAWDLGDPFGTVINNPNPFHLALSGTHTFHPMKGPMTTQSLRGMANAGPMHWRGDRTAGNDPGGDPLDEDGAFKKFNPAFVGLLGAGSQLSTTDMQSFTNFILTVQYPPSPIRSLDNLPTAAESAGGAFFFNTVVDTQKCNFCHVTNFTTFFGTDGGSSFEGEPQEFKVAHLRNLYQKIGMFGFPNGVPGATGSGFLGDQVRGFGFLHDGSISTVLNFLRAPVFNFPGNDPQRQLVESFVLSMDTGLRPIVGQQVSAGPGPVIDGTVTSRLAVMTHQADRGACDVVVHGNIGGEARGAVYLVGSTNWRTDRASDPFISTASLLALAVAPGQNQEMTFTAVPRGAGIRIGIDRDLDGFLDRTELDLGSDPADPGSVPGGTTTTTFTTTTTTLSTTTTTTVPPASITISARSFSLRDDNTAPIDLRKRKISFRTNTKTDPSGNRIVVPSSGSFGDPRVGGALLDVYNSSPAIGSPTDKVTVVLAAVNWKARGTTKLTYAYKGPDPNGPIAAITVKNDSLTIRGGKANWLYTLNESAQGKVAVKLTLGANTPWCADVPAKVSGNPPSTAKNDKPDTFNGQPKTSPPPTCPVPK